MLCKKSAEISYQQHIEFLNIQITLKMKKKTTKKRNNEKKK